MSISSKGLTRAKRRGVVNQRAEGIGPKIRGTSGREERDNDVDLAWMQGGDRGEEDA